MRTEDVVELLADGAKEVGIEVGRVDHLSRGRTGGIGVQDLGAGSSSDVSELGLGERGPRWSPPRAGSLSSRATR